MGTRTYPSCRLLAHALHTLILLTSISQGEAQEPVDLAQAESYFQEAAAIALADGERLWGASLTGPLLFVDPVTRAVVGNMADSAGVLTRKGSIFVGTLPVDVRIANTATRWSGRKWTMLLWPLPIGRFDRARLIAHEMFHRVQEEVGLPMRDPPNAHLEEMNARVLMRLEWRALAEALAGEGEERRARVADALSFRTARRALTPDVAQQENSLELSEGLAEYTGLRGTGLPVPLLRGWVVSRLEHHDSRAREASIVRNFAYASGPAYGLLLDETQEGWRRELDANSDLGALLGRAFRLADSVDTLGQYAPRASRYDILRLRAEEAAREAERRLRTAQLRAAFIDGPVLRLPMAGNLTLSFDPNGAESVDGAGTIYRTAEIGDLWGTLRVERGGVLLLRDAKGMFTGVVVPAPANSAARPVFGDGWTLQLSPGWTLRRGPRPGDVEVARAQ